MDMMSQGNPYLEKMYKRKGINLEESDARTKVQTDSRKLQNGKFPRPEASQLEKPPYSRTTHFLTYCVPENPGTICRGVRLSGVNSSWRPK